jgi:hypothetical protein
MLRAENLLTPLDGKILYGIHMLTATIVPLPRIPFSILIGHDGALGSQDGGTGEVLRSNQKQLVTLPLFLGDDRVIDLRICRFECV